MTLTTSTSTRVPPAAVVACLALALALDAGCLEGGRRLATLPTDDALGALDTGGGADAVDPRDVAPARDTSVLGGGDGGGGADTRPAADAEPGDADASGVPCLRVTPAGPDFGTVAVGSSKTLDLFVANCGGATIPQLTVALAEPGVRSFRVVGDPARPWLAPANEWRVTIAFEPVPAEANVRCHGDDLEPIVQQLVVASRGEDRVVVPLVGTATAPVSAESCDSRVRFEPEAPGIAGEPLTVIWEGNPRICLRDVTIQPDGTWLGGYGVLDGTLGADDGSRVTWVPPDAGLYVFKVIPYTAWPDVQACPPTSVTYEVQPAAGFVAKLRWTHAGASGADPLGDARLLLHVARLQAPGAAPPFGSSLWDVVPGQEPRAYGATEMSSWPTDPLTGYGRVEGAEAGQAFAVGVESETWQPAPNGVHAVDAELTVEIWVRGELVHTVASRIRPGRTLDLVRMTWGADAGGAPYRLTPGPDHP